MRESASYYTHSGSLREYYLDFKGNKVLVAQKPRYEELVRSNDTGEEIPFSLAQTGQHGQDFTVIGQRQVGVFVLIPGCVGKHRFRKDEKGVDISLIKSLIAQSDRSDL